ncbi:hypothetical protein KHO49_16360 [Pseudomonas sp. RC4D1]|uniref:hypothetical protein n=1 Tax=Pseudomonas sp. RC4D1 TaxID=2834407 RepID=UPI001BCF95C6|nr:hypothetical protein [Pseudomonas sp. RC4D1]MBS7559917.1 hypothetical protein [Pseudomonas sp. RC4D1]
MKKSVALALLVLIPITMTGCTYLFPRKIPVLGIEQRKACPAGERVYYYRDADVAACLPDVMVAYTHCVTELTVASTNSKFSVTTKAEIAEIVEKVKGINLSDEQKRDLEKSFETAGVIGEARAKAITACLELTEKVYGSNPQIKAVPTEIMQLQRTPTQ